MAMTEVFQIAASRFARFLLLVLAVDNLSSYDRQSGVHAQLGCITESAFSGTPDVNSTMGPPTGTSLYCYECQDPGPVNISNSPCLNQLSTITVRQCSPADRYCQVTVTKYDNFYGILSITRGCTNQCLYGCARSQYGAAHIVCTSCCRGYGCNTISGVTSSLRHHGAETCLDHYGVGLLSLLCFEFVNRLFR